ncbi:ROK family transcriptional regulator [Actinomadura sp. KC216]|uniref:ROK family transcriptional regulator n=1 Tax=Actinomadura sp. KC216 TaxID=2530370 RepID=UPI001052DCF7|nr:ROK family transcriptional regulator [Actinomadura sp. KC216]TDB75393.1 ROK family transcriptional regulator [Actinomadura sp. KC216]
MRPSLHGGDPSVLRRLNSAATLRALRDGGECTLTELAGRVGLSRPTTEGVLAGLIDRGLAAESAPRPGAGLGRPARRYRFRADAGYALGIDIDAHRVSVAVADLTGDVVGGHRAGLDVQGPPGERIAAVRDAVTACLAAVDVDRRSLLAVAAGTPGVVAPDGTVTSCTAVPGWEGVRLGRELARSFSCPVLVENDANLAAVAERWRGAARDTDDVVCVHAGLHTGMGAIIGGRLHRGRWGAAGEVGMLPELGLRYTTAALLTGTDACPKAAEAALAAFASGVGDAPGAALRGAGVDHVDHADRVLEAAGWDAAEAKAVVERLAARMARGVAAMALALDPEMIVVGGPLVRAGDLLVTELRRRIAPLCLSPVRIEASELADEAVGLGAVRLALDRIDEDLFRLDRRPAADA